MSEEGMNGSAEDRRRDEAMRRNMEFIIQQQAEFAAGMQQLRVSQESAERRLESAERKWESAERRWERTEEGIRSLLAIAEIHEKEIDALKEAQDRTDRQMAQTDRQMAETDRRMAETDERINALINFVERMLDERGGRPQG